jgi:hypothetical protein
MKRLLDVIFFRFYVWREVREKSTPGQTTHVQAVGRGESPMALSVCNAQCENELEKTGSKKVANF